jgi:hypothetical protein
MPGPNGIGRVRAKAPPTYFNVPPSSGEAATFLINQ